MTGNKSFDAYYWDKENLDGIKLNTQPCETLREAQKVVQSDSHYKKSLFGKRGDATSKNPDSDARYRIFDNVDVLAYWSIRS